MMEESCRRDSSDEMGAPAVVTVAEFEVLESEAEGDWKIDVPRLVGTLERARLDRLDHLKRQGVSETDASEDSVVAHYDTQLEMMESQKRLHLIQAAVQRRSEVPHFDEDKEPASRAAIDFGIKSSLLLNVFLLLIKLIAAYRSGSVTVLASLIDSILDLMSGGILVVVSMMQQRSSQEMFPGGKHFFEPLGTLVFSCAMFVSATKLLQEVADEVSDMDNVKFEMDVATLLILLVVIATKSVAAYLCFKFGTGSSALIALAEDHRNDIIANIVALLGFVCAVHITPWIDPVLGLGVTLFILFVWASKILEQLQLLSGKIAPEDYRNAITVLARNHDRRVLQVDTVRAFTAGTGYVVEVDLVLPEGMPLKEAHDIGESLQMFLEGTPQLNVSRAYVHLDTETDHDPKRHM